MESHSLLNQGVSHSYVNFELFINLGWLILFFSIKIDIKGKVNFYVLILNKKTDQIKKFQY